MKRKVLRLAYSEIVQKKEPRQEEVYSSRRGTKWLTKFLRQRIPLDGSIVRKRTII